MRRIITCFFSLLIIIINIFTGYYFAPIEMFTTVIVLPITTLYICLYCDVRLINRMLLVCSLIIINDLGIKFYGGGHHDQIGQFLINSSSIIGVLLAYIVLFIYIIVSVRNEIYTKQKYVRLLILFPLIRIVYFFLTWNVGLGRYI